MALKERNVQSPIQQLHVRQVRDAQQQFMLTRVTICIANEYLHLYFLQASALDADAIRELRIKFCVATVARARAITRDCVRDSHGPDHAFVHIPSRSGANAPGAIQLRALQIAGALACATAQIVPTALPPT